MYHFKKKKMLIVEYNYHIIMNKEAFMTFEWDENKNKVNITKHGIDFKIRGI